MKRMKTQVTLLIFLTIIVPVGKLLAQTEIESEAGIFAGREHNIFKSPDVLLDRETRDPLPTDSIIYSDLFFDGEFDFDYFKMLKKNQSLNLGADIWYRKYVEFGELDQKRMSAQALYSYGFSEKFNIISGYELRWSDRVGTSVTGDLLMRSFKYLGHSGIINLRHIMHETLEMSLLAEIEYKNYYDERTRDPLDQTNIELTYEMNHQPSDVHEFELELAFNDRNYRFYHALNDEGKYFTTHPFRNFRYYDISFDYDWEPADGLRINPEIEYTRRIDMFQGYYSYKRLGGGLRLRYYFDKYYFYIYADYQRQEYDKRPAFTTETDDPMLVYGFMDFNITIRYSLTDKIDLFIDFESDNRSSNTNLEYFKTRRPYRNNAIWIGAEFELLDIEKE